MNKKRNKVKVIIALTLLLLLIGGFLLKKVSQVSASWYNTSWLYRKSLSVSNSGSTLTNEDVLIAYDTASLITAGKLQSDCDDLRFVDSDDSTALIYWVEGGCNSSTTHIWVRIPSLTAGGKTIYMYYGNSSATNAEETWTGKFYLMKTSACDTGWTTESNSGGDFFERFPSPASTFGTTGGSSSHAHDNVILATSTVNTGSPAYAFGLSIAGFHNHGNITRVISNNSSVLPPYLDMIFCSNNDLIIKQNTVAEFVATPPSGFTRFSALDTKFPRGNSSYGGTSANTTHTHSVPSATTGGPSYTISCASSTGGRASSTHTHTFPATTTGTGTQIPIYMEIIYGQADVDIMAPFEMLTMSNATPPLGWTRYSALDGYFPYGATSFGTTGGTLTHNHTFPAATSGPMSSSVSCIPVDTILSPTAHTHSTPSSTTSDYSNTPPYISTLFIQKKTSKSVTINNEEEYNYSVSPDAPSSLYIESSSNPIKVTDTTPEFSAVFTDTDTFDTGNYYQIQVNTQSDFLGTSMWDSTKTSISPITNGNRSPDISYLGSTLSLNGATYYIRMKFWDNKDLESNWSTTSSFIMDDLHFYLDGLKLDGIRLD